MNRRTVLVPVEYYNYSPHPIIIGIMRANNAAGDDAATVLAAAAAAAHPQWDTLAFAEQTPVGWSRRNALRVKLALPAY